MKSYGHCFSRSLLLCAVAVGLSCSQENNAWARLSAGKIVVIGDDLLSGKGLFDREGHFDVQLKEYLHHNLHADFDVVSVAQDGATSTSALALIPQVVAEKPQLVILAIGYNEALAKTDTDVVYNNMDNLLKELDRVGVYVLLVGIEAPLWLDHTYAANFNNVYPNLAQRYRVVYNNGFLKGVQGNPNFTQEDRYHPNRFGIAEIVKNMMPGLEPMVRVLKRVARCKLYYGKNPAALSSCIGVPAN